MLFRQGLLPASRLQLSYNQHEIHSYVVHLSDSRTKFCADNGLAALAACHRLRSINLTWCTQVTDASITAIAAGELNHHLRFTDVLVCIGYQYCLL